MRLVTSASRTSRSSGIAVVFVCSLLAAGCDSKMPCQSRGELDKRYCDANLDFLADIPDDSSQWKDPPLLLFTYAPVEDPALYEQTFQDFLTYEEECIGKQLRFYRAHSNAAAIEAMRSGRIHIGTFSTGDTPFAVNSAGAIPFAMRGDKKGPEVYQQVTIVKSSSPYLRVAQLKGKKIAHVAPTSNSGDLAPRALLPAEGLTPDRDYTVSYSGKHENSVIGVVRGDYDAANVASGVLSRMVELGQIDRDDLRVVFRSSDFPAGSLVMAHDLAPALQQKIRECTFSYRYSAEMTKAFQGADRWWPLDYKRDWAIVRKVAAGNSK